MPYITPNTQGHYPRGYPKNQGVYPTNFVPYNLDAATENPDLEDYKNAISDVQNSTLYQDYTTRTLNATGWWNSWWDCQDNSGRKMGDPRRGIEPWPWMGASDTRVRTVEKVINQHRTLCTFALRNMKIQAKSAKPIASVRESNEATTLLNWMLFSHMQAELHRELRLAIAWRNGLGSAILKTDWRQMRQLDYIDVSVMGLQEFVNEPAVRAFVGSGNQIPIGENLQVTDLQEMILDPAYEQDLSELLRAVSHDLLTPRSARKKLDDLRQLRTVTIPIPYVFESRPRLTAFRPMADVLFPTYADDLQRVPWIASIEYVGQAELRDRIETAQYDPKFVDSALEFRGPVSGSDWRVKISNDRATAASVGGNSMDADIELVHFYSIAHDRGVPIRFHTVFHQNVEFPASHEPDGYDHGQSCFHPMRFELDDRPIISSRGIAEIAYTWEQELKQQYDAWVDKSALDLRPPLMTSYDNLQKIKDNVMPGVVFPMRNFDQYEFMKLPPMAQASILVVQEVEKRIREHFAIFGADVDPDLMKLRREELTDDILSELKAPFQQIGKLMKQLLPEDDVAQVIGQMARPFHTTREVIQGEYDYTITVDLRDIDADWFKEKRQAIIDAVNLDVQGLTNRTPILKALYDQISPEFSDQVLPDNQQVHTEAEVQDEQKAIDLIIGSGQDQPLPQGANFQLRLQTLQAKQQAITSNPATMKIIQSNPDIIKVLMNRAQYFERQLQQQQNAQIGRMQVTNTFTKDAPQTQAQTGMQGSPVAGNALGY